MDHNQRSDERDRPLVSDPSPAPPADTVGGESFTPDTELSNANHGGPPARSRWSRVRRVVRGVVWAFAVLVAVGVVTLFSINLGPSLRGLAERQGANFMKREFTIGRLSARLLTGDLSREHVRVGGLSKGDRPFFTAGRIVVDVPWWSILTRELVVEGVDVRDWRMVVETWPDGHHDFSEVHARDEVDQTETLRDHRPRRARQPRRLHLRRSWRSVRSVTAQNLDVTISKTDTYRGTAAFRSATIRIAKFEPMWARMKSRCRSTAARCCSIT